MPVFLPQGILLLLPYLSLLVRDSDSIAEDIVYFTLEMQTLLALHALSTWTAFWMKTRVTLAPSKVTEHPSSPLYPQTATVQGHMLLFALCTHEQANTTSLSQGSREGDTVPQKGREPQDTSS